MSKFTKFCYAYLCVMITLALSRIPGLIIEDNLVGTFECILFLVMTPFFFESIKQTEIRGKENEENGTPYKSVPLKEKTFPKTFLMNMSAFLTPVVLMIILLGCLVKEEFLLSILYFLVGIFIYSKLLKKYFKEMINEK